MGENERQEYKVMAVMPNGEKVEIQIGGIDIQPVEQSEKIKAYNATFEVLGVVYDRVKEVVERAIKQISASALLKKEARRQKYLRRVNFKRK